jgi:succinyl-diaminopimelate desuccinylase
MEDRVDKSTLDAYFKGREESLVEAIALLVAVRSVREEALPSMPFGRGPAEALETALRMADSMGLRTMNMDNYAGVVDLGDGEPALGILAHLDVVGEGTGWTTPPYTAVLKDGMLHGRGVADDKGPAVAALFALKAAKDLGVRLPRGVRLILGTDEESGSADIAHYAEREKFPLMTFSPDGAFPVTNTEKGSFGPFLEARWPESDTLPRVRSLKGGFRTNVVPPEAEAVIEGMDRRTVAGVCDSVAAATRAAYTVTSDGDGIRVHVKGAGGHAAEPWEANNALTALLAAIARMPIAPSPGFTALQGLASLFPHGDWLGEAAGIAMSDDISGPLTLAFSLLDVGPTGLSGRFDSRTPLRATKESTIDVVAPRLLEAGIAMGCPGLNPPHHTPCDSPFVRTLLSAYERHTGLKGACAATGGGTYVHHIDGGVCFGACMPGFQANMHGPGERVPVADLLTASKIFTQVICDLCGG